LTSVAAAEAAGQRRRRRYAVESTSRVGRTDDARRIHAEIERRGAGVDLGAGTWAMAHLSIGDEEAALEQFELGARKARSRAGSGLHRPDELRTSDDPLLAEPRFADVLGRIRGT
jgi:hypothetical protein